MYSWTGGTSGPAETDQIDRSTRDLTGKDKTSPSPASRCAAAAFTRSGGPKSEGTHKGPRKTPTPSQDSIPLTRFGRFSPRPAAHLSLVSWRLALPGPHARRQEEEEEEEGHMVDCSIPSPLAPTRLPSCLSGRTGTPTYPSFLSLIDA